MKNAEQGSKGKVHTGFLEVEVVSLFSILQFPLSISNPWCLSVFVA